MSNKKSSAKMAGLKSLQYLNDEETIALSFGKGNEAILEKSITKNNENNEIKISNISKSNNINLKLNPNNLLITNNLRKKDGEFVTGQADTITPNDFYDDLRFKDQLETEIFGKITAINGTETINPVSFKDNIRIQIAYNIFDIIKKLVPISANLCYSLNSLDRKNKNKDDIIGNNLNYGKEYNETNEKFNNFCENAKLNFAYYGNLFGKFKEEFIENKNQDKKVKIIKFNANENQEIYNTLLPVNFLRNGISHFNEVGKQDDKHQPIALFQNNYDNYKLITKILYSKFENAVKQINKNFFDNEKNNFYIFTQSLNQSVNDELSQFYYDFVIKKTDKNLGFSIKKLRELYLSKEFVKHNFTVQDFSSFKNKFNKIFDALATYYFKYSENNIANNFVDELRFSKDENEKEKVYEKYTNLIFTDNQNPLKQSIKKMDGVFKEEKEKGFKSKTEINKTIKEKISENSFTDFSKLIYYVCQFLSGKDINILLTTLINKFQVIDAFNKEINTLVSAGKIEPANYNARYELFENSEQVAEELNIIKSISKMELCDTELKGGYFFNDVLYSLGLTYYDENFKDIKTSILKNKSYKEFILNNILKSRRYKYMVKYIRVTDINSIMKCRSVVSYIINKMPDSQIDSYCKTLNINSVQDKNKEIIDRLVNIDYTKVFPTNLKNKEENTITEENKQLLTLYYTVAYIFVKNLIYINSLYITAYYFRERDNFLVKEKYNIKDDNGSFDFITRVYTGLYPTNSNSVFLKQKHINKLKKYIPENDYKTRNYNQYMYKPMRNNIDHLNIISIMGKYIQNVDNILKTINETPKYSSKKTNKKVTINNKPENLYFSIYHYLLQTKIIEFYNNSKINFNNDIRKGNKNFRKNMQIENINLYFNKKYGFTKKISEIPNAKITFLYDKEFLRALNIPFGYNVPRYKNLTYEKYFNSHYIDE